MNPIIKSNLQKNILLSQQKLQKQKYQSHKVKKRIIKFIKVKKKNNNQIV